MGAVKQVGAGVFDAALFGAGHGVGAEELGALG